VDDGFLRLKAVIAKTGVPRSSLYRMIKQGTFPRQVPLSHRSVGWRASAVQRWLDNPTGFRQQD
jgi:prophage regulatory protein